MDINSDTSSWCRCPWQLRLQILRTINDQQIKYLLIIINSIFLKPIHNSHYYWKEILFSRESNLKLKTWLLVARLEGMSCRSKLSTAMSLSLTTVKLHSVLCPAYSCNELLATIVWGSDSNITLKQQQKNVNKHDWKVLNQLSDMMIWLLICRAIMFWPIDWKI